MAYTTINKSTDYFNTKLYTGNGSTNAITGVGFQPDWVWIKNRTDISNHNLYDAVRGTSAGKLKSNTTNAESYNASDLSTFGTDGFTVGGNNEVNGSGDNMVSWNWKANGAGSSNTDGSISSTVSVNTTAGFSIVSYTGNGTAGATIGHGLGTVPSLIIARIKSQAKDWNVYHVSNGATKQLVLNSSAAVVTTLDKWNNTTPTSSVFTVGDSSQINMSGESGIAYCFAEKQGYSKFGSYTGNGNNDGTFVYTGFKPAWVMTKRNDTTSSWDIHDTKRDTFNVASKHLLAEDSGVEGNTAILDILSNGFKFRSSNADRNASGGTYIYMAFAESPLVGTNGVTAKAR